MPNVQKILLPVDFPNASLGVLHHAAIRARHFHPEIVILHVVTVQSQAAGVPEDASQFANWDLLAEIFRRAETNLGHALESELKGLAIRCVLLKGDPVEAILQTAQVEKADLIMMPSHGFAFNRFLLGSVTAKVLYGTECPVWTGAHVEESQPKEFAIRKVLCAVDLTERSGEVFSWGAKMATEFGARLTLAHVTASVEVWGPGGNYANPRRKQELYDDAAQ